jgi:hypothetical protein
MADSENPKISEELVEKYEFLSPLIARIYEDVQELTKKKQDGVLSKTRIAMVNRLLETAKQILKDEPSSAYLDLLDEHAIPQNADAMLIVGQYVSALQAFKRRYTRGESYELYWQLKGQKQYRKAL